MSFRMFVGGTFEHTHERKQMEQIKQIVQRLYKEEEGWCALFADVVINGRQLDGFLLKKDHLIIFEMKTYRGKIVADLREEKKWIIDPPDDVPFEPDTNPFYQVRRQRGIIASLLARLMRLNYEQKGQLFSFISAWIVIPQDAKVTTISNEKISEKWFKVTPMDRLEKEIPYQVSREYLHLESEDILDQLAAEMHVRETDPSDWLKGSPDRTLVRKTPGLGAEGGELRFRALDHMLSSGVSERVIKAKDIVVTLELNQYANELLKLSEHPDPEVRYHVLDSLQYLSLEKDLTPLLLRFLSDDGSHRDGKGDFKEDLSLCKEDNGSKATRAPHPPIPELATNILIALGSSQATPELVRIIQDENSTENNVMNAVRVLKEIGGEAAVDPIIELTENYSQRFPDSTRFRPLEELIAALGETGSPKAVSKVLEFITHDEEELRSFAIEALGRIGDGRSREALVKLLNTKGSDTSTVIAALGDIADPGLAEHLYPFLKTDDWYTLARTLEALRNMGSPDSFSPIWTAFITRPNQSPAQQGMMIDVLAQLDGKKLEELLIKLLNTPKKETRETAARFLPRVLSVPCLDSVLPFLGDSEPELRKSVCDAVLAAVTRAGEEKKQLPRILALLGSQNEKVRAEAAGLAFFLGGEDTRAQLAPLESDPSKLVREAVGSLLGSFGEKTL